MAEQGVKSEKGLGPKYGIKARRRMSEVKSGYIRKLHKCSECGGNKVKRLAAGIWQCQKCGNKFASHSYRVV
jgi:large subunit ribosomal protein L37Ae